MYLTISIGFSQVLASFRVLTTLRLTRTCCACGLVEVSGMRQIHMKIIHITDVEFSSGLCFQIICFNIMYDFVLLQSFFFLFSDFRRIHDLLYVQFY